MSTVGKVLVVLVTVLMIVWIVLVSGMTELNKNWAKALDAQKKQTVAVEDEIPGQRRKAVQFHDEANIQQVATGEAVALLQERQVRLERNRSRALDETTRLKFQLERSQTIEQTAKLDSETRLKEREDTKLSLDDARKIVKKSQAENEELMATLAHEREEFRKVFRENREKLRERAKKISE